MRNKKVIYDKNVLNATTGPTDAIKINLATIYTPYRSLNPLTVYPRDIKLVNDTGVELAYLILANSAEKDEYDAGTSPLLFSFTRLPIGGILVTDGTLQSCYAFYIYKNSGSLATSDLIIDFLNFKEKK